MARARIQYNEQPNRVILTYHLPAAWLAPAACFWCLVGGSAVGTGVAVALSAAEIGTIPFRQSLIAVTLIAAILLYLWGYVLALRSRYLRITFDYGRDRLNVEAVYAGRRPAHYAFAEIETFELVDRSTRWQTGCALTLVRRSTPQPETLLALPRGCDDERTALPHFVARLEAQLEADPYAVDEDMPPTLLHVTPPIPARRWQPDFPNDDDDDQQSS